MEHSAGVVFIKGNQVLLCHATETPKWDIPKGHVENYENAIDAAVRECFEETGFVVDKTDLVSLGEREFSSNKKVHPFLFVGKDFPDPSKLYCTSTFEKEGRTVYEMDAYKYVDFSEITVHTGKSLNILLHSILNELSLS